MPSPSPNTISEERIIPIVRARLAERLSEEGFRSKDIAAALNVTQSAVAQYLKRKRGASSRNLSDVDLLIAPLAEKVAKRIRSGAGEIATLELLETAHQLLILNRGRDVARMDSAAPRQTRSAILLRERLKLELNAAEKYLELANKAEDDQTKLLLRMIASDSVRHGDVVAQMITWLDAGGDSEFEVPPKDLLETLLAVEDSANEVNLGESIEVNHPVGRLLLEWIDADEAKHGRIVSRMLALSKKPRRR